MFGELRTKVLRLNIDENEVLSSNYFGLGNTKKFSFDQLEGYKVSLVPAYIGTYECLYLMAKNKKVVKISAYYYRNYNDLKKIVEKNLKYLGSEHFEHLREFKEIFS